MSKLIKLTKSQVIKKIKENGSIDLMLVPCKANIESPWIVPYYVEGIETVERLERVINSFTVYNCNYELGYYPHYYIEA